MKRVISGTVASLALLMVAGCAATQGTWDFFRGHIGASSDVLAGWTPSDDAMERGAMQFAFGDYGGLNSDAMDTVAVPWKLTAAALVLHQSPDDISPDALKRIMRDYGFFYPERIENWPQGAPTPPMLEVAMGLILGTGTRSIPHIEVQIAGIGCAACHSAPVYDAQGKPQPERIWMGAPNPSLDMDRYTQGIYDGMTSGMRDKARLMAAVRTLYPAMTAREEKTLRDFVLPRVEERLTAIAATGGRPLPYTNGHAGVSNGLAALKLQHGLLEGDAGAYERERGLTSIPHLSDRMWRSMLLWDGVYAPANASERQREMRAEDLTEAHKADLAAIAAYFTVPTMAMTGEGAVRAIPTVRETFGFVGTVRPQIFPGQVDRVRAERGAQLFAQNCSTCHGTYQETAAGPRLNSFPNKLSNVGTDPVRAELADDVLAAKINTSPMRRYIRAEHTGRYAPPPLTGIWQSAPYLHNGSVPSLAALLGLEERPQTFSVGGHAMDLDKVGVAYPAGYQPYSRPSQVDTRQRGMGNGGHTRMFADLGDEDKRDLLEYLKRL